MWENSEDLGYFCLPAPPLPQTIMSFPVRSVLKSVCVPWCASFFYSSQLFRPALRSCVRLSPRRVSPPPRRSPLLSRSAWLSSSQKKLKMYALLAFRFALFFTRLIGQSHPCCSWQKIFRSCHRRPALRVCRHSYVRWSLLT